MKHAEHKNSSQNGRYSYIYLFISIFILALVLRIYGLGDESYWFDEFITIRVAQEGVESILSGGRPPLYLLIAHFWIELVGTSEIATRLLSVFFGLGSVYFIYRISKSLFNDKVGLISAFFMSLSQYQIYYSQEFRYYSLFLLITLISYFYFLKVLQRKRYSDSVLYVVSSILLYYTHDFGIFILAAQNLYVLLKIRSLRAIIPGWILSQIIILAAITPRLLSTIFSKALGSSGPNWLEEPGIMSPFITLYYYVGSGFDYPSLIFLF